jgi:hypothetical protein
MIRNGYRGHATISNRDPDNPHTRIYTTDPDNRYQQTYTTDPDNRYSGAVIGITL